ncbi:MAG: MBL fold metallo-hydrolase [FCB group bacterium]|jgi:ribonuclease Z|nr:MBL fold metallo-hydrolase [FCB group bacterium]
MPTAVVRKSVGGVEVVGYSLAGEETTIALPELNICFDAGRAPRDIIPIDTLCLSHGHMDHAAGVPYYLSQRAFVGTSPGRVFMHRRLIKSFEALMACWADIEGHPSPMELYGLTDGERFPLRRNLFLHAFDVNHGASALGFSVVELRHKLKPEYTDRSGPQLVELKKQGVEIEHTIEVPLVAYCGDSADGAFFDLDHVRNARLLIMECTFFDPDHVVRARAGKHVHVRDLPGILPRLRSPNILLTHVTRRTDIRTVKRIFESSVDKVDRDRITFLMDRPRNPNRPNRPDTHAEPKN